MRRILTIAILICLVAFAFLYPVIEGLDRWDAPGPSSDSKIQIIALLTPVGMMFALARLVALVLSWLVRVLFYLDPPSRNSLESSLFELTLLRNPSPPAALRI